MSTIFVAKLGADDLEIGLKNQAVAFFNGGSRCAADISISPIITNSPMAPAIVCYAFSLELFIKLLHVITLGKRPKQTHKIFDIYSDIPPTPATNYQQNTTPLEEILVATLAV